MIAALTAAVEAVMEPWLSSLDLGGSQRQLMRWGAAYPLAPGLPVALRCCAQSQLAFCGDFMAGVGFGRIEGALRSGEDLARELCSQPVNHCV